VVSGAALVSTYNSRTPLSMSGFFQIAIEDKLQRGVTIQAGEVGDAIKPIALALSQAHVVIAVFLFIDAINRCNLFP
jgi:hypothetical protein